MFADNKLLQTVVDICIYVIYNIVSTLPISKTRTFQVTSNF